MEFTNNWFDPHIPTWNRIVPRYDPSKILEVGANEGRIACHMIELQDNLKALDIVCVNTAGGGRERADIDLGSVETSCRPQCKVWE